MSPYIVTTTTEQYIRGDSRVMQTRSRSAVATLDEARELVRAKLPTEASMWDLGSPESGGTVGPLPDGTVIEVKRVQYLDLVMACHGISMSHPASEILDAFNTQETRS